MDRFVMTFGASPPPAVEDYMNEGDVAALSFTPDGHLTWAGADATVRAATWWTGRHDHVVADDGSLTVWGGNLRVAGSPGPPAGHRLREILCRADADPRESLRDAYAIATIDRHGNGLALGDELSIHPMFVAHPAPGVVVVGNRPALVAEIDARWRGVPVQRSIEAAEWMAFAGYVVGDASGFASVRQLPQGAAVRVTAGRPAIEPGTPVYVGEPGDRVDVAEFADRLEADLVDGLRHALAMADRPELELTGGKDSRLLFALAHRAGLLDEFSVTSYGSAELLDVQVAAALCDTVGVAHNHIRTRKSPGTRTYPSLARVRRHVHRTGGVSQIGDAVEPTPGGPVYVSGLFGEYFRTDHKAEARRPAESVEEAARRFATQRRFGSAGILSQQVIDRLGAVALSLNLEPADRIRGPADLRSVFITRFRFPGWQNPLTDRNTDALHPFLSGPLVREVFRVPAADRALELPHRLLMERADPRIARHPFANDAWRRPTAAVSPDSAAAIEVTAIEPTPPVEGTSSVRIARGWLPVNREDLAALIDGDRRNPVFDFVDFDALRGHVMGDGPGDPLASLQVNGALASFLWLGAHDLPSRADG